jgi:hypothetical protein
MLWTVAVILIVLWLLGLITAHTIGGFIHVLLVIAIDSARTGRFIKMHNTDYQIKYNRGCSHH